MVGLTAHLIGGPKDGEVIEIPKREPFLRFPVLLEPIPTMPWNPDQLPPSSTYTYAVYKRVSREGLIARYIYQPGE